MSLTQYAHRIIGDYFAEKQKKLAIDATCGNGHDTEFLCELGFDHVMGFDIQTQAIEQTRQRLQDKQLTATLIQDGHENMHKHFNGEFDCAMFNFGYLPKADKNLTTKTDTSLKALQIGLNNLNKAGLISLMCYPGHPEGVVETKAIIKWLNELGDRFTIERHLSKSPSQSAPILYLIYHADQNLNAKRN